MGALHFGFEEIGQVLTNERGEFSLAVTVPPWARRDLTHRFIVFDYYFVPIALTDMFHVTDAEGVVSREGVLADVRSGCPALRADDGLVYGLSADRIPFKEGARVVVEGKIAEVPACPRPTTLAVLRITKP